MLPHFGLLPVVDGIRQATHSLHYAPAIYTGLMVLSSTKPAFRALSVCLLLEFTMCQAPMPLAGPYVSHGGDKDIAATTEPSMGRHLKLEGVPNFGEVTPMLFRGGQPKPKGFAALAKMGISIVVDTGRSKRDEKQIKDLGMRYVSLPWYCPLPKDEVFARFLKLLKDNPDKKIFVHCRLGDDRTGMMIAAYRMGAQGWTADQARKEMSEFGYTRVHHLMCPRLGGYEKSFPERLRNSPAFRELP